MQFAKFKLSPPRNGGSVSCDELGPKVGNVRLMKRTLDEYGDEVWAPRDLDTLNALLTAHYQCPIDLTGKIEGLHAVARTLNKGDVTHACFVTIFLQFPDQPPFDDEAEDRYGELLASLQWSGLLKADEDWNRKHPRTNESPNRGWFAPVPKEDQSRELDQSRRWPPKEVNKKIRVWAADNPKLSPKVPRGNATSFYLEVIAELLKELGRMELNVGEDLITAQLHAYHDSPKTLEELQIRPDMFPDGYEQHHIVEQNDENRRKFGNERIDDPSNIIWISRLRHEQLTAEYNSIEDEETTTLRERMRSEDFETQREKGLELLRKYGVLK
ncbi:hypothetical protein [Methyloferula stellata]|uniref:hypothetical protein n=1 Tax=Methyloferula stellata TaxID=876270 RepID=UPI000366AD3F|nr:hypothetical protein [Methyloferula stellata]